LHYVGHYTVTFNTYTNQFIFMYCKYQYTCSNLHCGPSHLLSCILQVIKCILQYRTKCLLYSIYIFYPQILISPFLGVFSKLRKAIISFVMSFHLSVCTTVRPSVFPQKRLGFHWMEFHKMCYFKFFFRKYLSKIQDILKSAKHKRYFTWRPIYIYECISSSSS
jgi:hypothetical protein